MGYQWRTYNFIVISVARWITLDIKNQTFVKTCSSTNCFVRDGEVADNEFEIKFPQNIQAKVRAKLMQQSLPYKAILGSIVHYRVHKSAPLKHILNKISVVNTVTQWSFVIHFRIILLSVHVSAKWLINFRFFRLKFYPNLSYLPRVLYVPLFHLPWFSHSTQ